MKKRIDLVLEKVLIFLLALMLVAVLWQVFSRYFLRSPSSFTEELARYCLIWIGTLGAAYAAGQNMHLSINILPNRLEGIKKVKLQVVLNVLIILFALTVFCLGGSRLVYITVILGQNSPALGIPLSFVYLILPVSGIVIILYQSLQIKKILGGTHGN